MNKIYKVIWSKTRNCYVAVSEIAKRNGKDRTSVTGGAAGSRQAARVLCALLLGAYLTAGYSMPVAWGADGYVIRDGDTIVWGKGTTLSQEVVGAQKTIIINVRAGTNVTADANGVHVIGSETLTNDGKLMTGTAVTTALSSYTKKSDLSAGNGLSLSGTTYSVKANGNSITVGSAGIKVSDTITGDINSLKNTVGNISSGLVKDVNDNKTALQSKANAATSLSGYGITDAYTKSETDTALAAKANAATTLEGYGITDAAMLDASNLSAANITAWGTKLGTGTISPSSGNLVTGKTVYAEVRPASNGTYVQTTNTTATNLTALDAQVKANADALAGKASTTAVTTLEGKVAANESAIADKADASSVYTKAELDTQLGAKADASSVYTKAETDTKLNAKANAADVYTKTDADGKFAAKDSVYTKTEMDTQLSAKADASSVYTKAETDTKLNAKANAADVYTKTDADSTFAKKADVYTKTDVDTKLNAKADKSSVYTKTETDAKLDSKANAADVYTKTDADGKFAAKDSVYTKTEMDTQLSAKADTSNVYTKSDVDTKLDAKADKTVLSAVETTANTAKTTADAAKMAADSATATANAAKAAVDTIGDPVKINTLVTDVDTLKANEGGEVVAPGEVKANKNVTGGKVYNYLNGEALALGANSNRIAMGSGSSATGTQSIAIGFGNTVSGANSGAFGDPNTVTGTGSYALGNNNTIGGNNTFVLGSNVTADVDDAVVLGNKSTAEAGAVSVGSDGGERQIKHVAEGTDDTDAVNKRQMDAAIDNAVGNNMINMSNQINKLDSRINKVGAGAAALAALHPLDMDGKFGLAAGFGNYRNANAMALGFFYRPTDRVMFSVGGSMGNGENMMNAGVSIALDKGVNTSKAAMARKIHAQDTEIQTLKAENAEIKEQNAKLAERLAAIEAKLGK